MFVNILRPPALQPFEAFRNQNFGKTSLKSSTTPMGRTFETTMLLQQVDVQVPTVSGSGATSISNMADTEESSSSFDGPIVLVLGLTGAGKSTLINQLTNANLPVGRGMEACTTTSAGSFGKIDDVEVAFVDTPGFDDPEKSDARVVIDITKWIAENLGGTQKVTAALYLHSIATKKMHGSAIRNFTMFSKLIGSNSMKNVGLVSTHWDAVDKGVAEERQAFLMARPWDLMIRSGARMYQLDNRYETCSEMVVDLLKAQPSFLKIQKEMAKEFQHKPLSRTDVGKDVSRELEERIATEQTNILQTNELLSTGTFEAPEMKEELQRSLQKSEQNLARLLADREDVKKTPTWGEAAWSLTKACGPFLVQTAIQSYQSRGVRVTADIAMQATASAAAKAVEVADSRAAAAMAELAIAKGKEVSGAETGLIFASIMGVGGLIAKAFF
jgi:GTP-binding protein EngB required for normal cell division